MPIDSSDGDFPSVFDPQSAKGEQADLRGKIIEYVIVALVVAFLAGYEWLRWAMQATLHPAWMTSFAMCIAGYCLVRLAILRPRWRALQSGQHLWQLMSLDFARLGDRGFYLFDGMADAQGAPLGPVLVGPTGVFSLTIRTNRPTGRFFEKVDHVDAATLRVGDRPAFADPLGHARQAARRVAAFLHENGQPGMPISPVLIFPGWQMGKVPMPEQRDVLVVNERTFASVIMAQANRLEPKAILEVCDVLRPVR